MKQPAELQVKVIQGEFSSSHVFSKKESRPRIQKLTKILHVNTSTNWGIFISLYLALNICHHIKSKNLNEGNNNIEDKSKISFTPLKDTEG